MKQGECFLELYTKNLCISQLDIDLYIQSLVLQNGSSGSQPHAKCVTPAHPTSRALENDGITWMGDDEAS